MNAIRILSRVLCALMIAAALEARAEGEYGLPMGDAAAEGMSAEKLAAIQGQLQTYVDEKKCPGFITAVARNGKLVHFNAFGKMDVERDKPMRPDTIFRMYSMTKPVTGAAIMILVDEGKLRVSDELASYIPEFKEMKVLASKADGTTELLPAERPITIKHLLTHTSGLTYGFLGTPVSKMYSDHGINSDGASGLTLEEFAKKVAAMPLVAQPGTEWNYSVAMDVLGRVVEVVTGQRYGDFLRARLFEPLGMKDSGFSVPAEKVERFASNYSPAGGSMMRIDDAAASAFLKTPSQDSGGGGMVGTAADYLRFAQMLLNGGELDGVRILSEAAVAEMTSNQLGPEFGESPIKLPFPIPLRGVGFGYCGAAVMDGVAKTLFGAAGQYSWGGLASTDFWIDKNEKIVGLILTQLVPAGTYPTRVAMNNAVYAAVEQKYAAGGASAAQ